MNRFELGALGACAAGAILAILDRFGVLGVAGALPLGLYAFYGVAAVAGWVAGNLYVRRTRAARRALRSLLLAVYLVGPAGPLTLLRAMAEASSQARAPLVPLFGFGVYAILFTVPVSLRRAATERRSLRPIGRPAGPESR